MRLYADIEEGNLRISNLDATSDRPVATFDTHADDFEEKVTAWCTERHAFTFMCSSSCDFPEDNGAPANFDERWSRAVIKALNDMYGSPDFPCIKCGERVGDAVSVMRDLAERTNKEPRKPKLCCACLWKNLENL